MSRILFDIESNGLLMDATHVWCIVIRDIDTHEIFTYRPEQIEEAIKHLKEASEIIGHNISLFDLPLLQRLYGLEWEDFNVVDTMLWSRLLEPDRLGGHSLEAWGERLGCKKIDFKDFSQFSETILDYCVQDVAVNYRLYTALLDAVKPYNEALSIEHKFAYIMSQQILNGFRLDVGFATQLKKELEDEYTRITEELREIMPRKRIETAWAAAKRDNRVITEDAGGYHYSTAKTGIIKYAEWKYEEPNPRSRQQIIDFFKTKYKWSPSKETEKGTPIIDETVLEGLPYPEAKLFSRMFYLNKKISMVGGTNGWLSYVTDSGRVHGSVITNGAVTGRCTHSRPNLAQIDSDERMRKCWIPRDDWVLVSCDADQLEARCLAHFMSSFDHGTLTHTILEGDLHTQNQRACGLEERKTAKTMLYAYMYGAGDLKLGKTAATEVPDQLFSDGRLRQWGRHLRESLMNSMEGLKPLTQAINHRLSERSYLFGLDGRPLHIRSQHAALNTLLQSAGAVIMKVCLIKFWELCKEEGYAHGVVYGLVANVHDEVVFEARDEEVARRMIDLFQEAMTATQEHFDFKCPLAAGGKAGANWAEIH